MNNFFRYQENSLFCEEKSIEEIATKVGTPFYIYSYSYLIQSIQQLKKTFSRYNPLICYSLKANPNITLCRIIASYGLGADIVSGGELYQALKAGFPSEKIVYSGVGKTPDEIKYALEKNILFFNVESEQELQEIRKIAEKINKKAKVSIRINPDIDANTHHYITTGKKENKFGIPFPQAEKIYKEASKIPSIDTVGIHMHLGSQIKNVEPYLEALQRLKSFIDKLTREGINLSYLDIGGGFGINYREKEEKFPVEKLSEKITLLVPPGMRLIIEPGRYIVGNAGALITKLIYKKSGKRKEFLIVDAGMNDLIRPSLYGAYHRIIPVKKPLEKYGKKVDIVGPICESTDFFAQNRQLPAIESGELIAILDAGAYGISMSSNYNGRLRVAEVLVKNDNWWLIKQKESYWNLTQGQIVPTDINLYHREILLPAPSSSIEFWKMEGAGNDFILLDNRDEIIKKRAELAQKLCQRKKGIGADGLILIERAKQADFFIRIFNPDGSEAEMCGNGARCAARFAYLKGIAGEECTFQTLAGPIKAKIKENKVKIKMSDPFDFKKEVKLRIDTREYKGYFINTGVPHFILFYESIDKVKIKETGFKIRSHKYFHPDGTNVDFVEIKDDGILIRTYERGVEDETLACGTGAVASAIISHLIYNLPPPVKVKMKGGSVNVWFESNKGSRISNVFLEGEANITYKGYLNGGDYV